MFQQNIIKINIGSGYIGLDDWINVDNSVLVKIDRFRLLKRLLVVSRIMPMSYYNLKFPKSMMIHDVRKGLPFSDNMGDYLFTSHFLEHLTRYEGRNLIQECFRVLKPHGMIRIVVPDLGLIISKYVQGDPQYLDKLREGLLGEYLDSMTAHEMEFADCISLLFYNIKNCIPEKHSLPSSIRQRLTSYHKWMYDFKSLKSLLEGYGFINIQQCQFHQGKVPDLDFLDRHPEISLYVEAEKPDKPSST